MNQEEIRNKIFRIVSKEILEKSKYIFCCSNPYCDFYIHIEWEEKDREKKFKRLLDLINEKKIECLKCRRPIEVVWENEKEGFEGFN